MAGREVGGGLVRERLAGLIVADHTVEPLVGRLVRRQVAQVAGSHTGRDPDQPGRFHPERASRLDDLERPVRIGPELALKDLECVGGGIEHRRTRRARPVVDAHHGIADDARASQVVAGGGDREVAHVRCHERLAQPVRADRRTRAARGQDEPARGLDPDRHRPARWRDERIAMVRSLEAASGG